MRQSIYLHRQVKDVLNCFGSLTDVINRILQEGANGRIDIMDKPPAPPRDGAARYDVIITDPNYLELIEQFTPFSPRISLRRLLYWFVENEVYNDLGWEQDASYADSKRKMCYKKIENALSELERAKQYVSTGFYCDLDAIYDKLKALAERIKNAR